MELTTLYELFVKHEPSGKFSARSSAYINMRGVPSKSLSYKNNQDLYSNTPIRSMGIHSGNIMSKSL